MESNLDLVRRLLRGSQQAAASQASQASLAASQQRASAGPRGGPSAFSCNSCGSGTPPRIDHSGFLICSDCGAIQEGEQLGTRDEEEEFEMLQSTQAMGAARVRSHDLLGSDAVAAALAAVGLRGPGAPQGHPDEGAAATDTPPATLPAASAAAAAAASQMVFNEDEDAEGQEEWGEGGRGAGASGAGDASAAAVAARVSRQQQQALGNYWQQPLLWLNAEEAAGETFGPDGAVSDAALLRCWALLLQSCCRLLQQEFGVSDLLELEARKVDLRALVLCLLLPWCLLYPSPLSLCVSCLYICCRCLRTCVFCLRGCSLHAFLCSLVCCPIVPLRATPR